MRNMKKLLLTMIIIIAVPVLAACGNGPDTDNSAIDANPASPDENINPVPSVFSFKMGDVLIEMDEDISRVIAGLGEPLGILEQESCAFDGIDRIFSYPGIQIYTYPKGNSDHIHTIGFFDDSVVTTEGNIRLGSDIQEVFNVYGNDYRYDSGMYTFTRGKTVLEFLVSGDNIISINYRYILDL